LIPIKKPAVQPVFFNLLQLQHENSRARLPPQTAYAYPNFVMILRASVFPRNSSPTL
jgi:hypothetical protein